VPHKDRPASARRARSRPEKPPCPSVSMPCHLSPGEVTCECGDIDSVPCAGARGEGGPVIFDVLVLALLMLSPFATLALPDPDSRRRRRRVPGPVGPLGVMAARWRGRRTVRRTNRAPRARAHSHRGVHRAMVMAQ